MSFVWKADKPLRTEEQVAREVHEVSLARGLDELATVIALMCIRQESNFWCPWNANDPSSQKYPHDSQSDDGRSVGYFQQQNGRAGEVLPAGDRDNWWGPMSSRMDLKQSTNVFLERLSDDYVTAKDGRQAGDFIQRVQRSAYPRAYDDDWDYCWALLRRALAETPTPPVVPSVPSNKPPFIENNVIGNWRGRPYGCSQSRNGQKPRFIVLHTSEGAGGPALLDFMQGVPVSYHYVVDDTGYLSATVWDLVDTDRAAWSVGNGNNYSINLCFGTSFAHRHNRSDWLRLQDDSIKAAAWIVAQDCKKYGIDPVIRVGGSASGYASLKKPGVTGITDHRGMTTIAGGDHTDVGPHFPWDVFNQYLQQYYKGTSDELTPEQDKMLREVHACLFNDIASQSLYADPDEGRKWKLHELIKNDDAMIHQATVEEGARLGDEDALRRVLRVAAGRGKYTHPEAIAHAEAVLETVDEDILREFRDGE